MMRLTTRMLLGTAIVILIGLLRSIPTQAALPPGSYMNSYISTIDKSTQSYGLYVPTTYNNFALHPVVFIGHGFNGHASSSFNSIQTGFAESYGWLLVQLEGRGNNFYDGVGEVDFMEVLAQLRSAYTLDANRLYFEGTSMGATGAYRQGIRHPDLLAAVGGADGFGDYRSWYTQYYGPASNPSYVEPFRLPNVEMSSCVDSADNARWQSIWMQAHTGDSSVLPANTYNLDSQLTTLAAPDGNYAHFTRIDPGGHVATYNQSDLYNYFLSTSLNAYPNHVTCKTNQLKYGRIHWVSIDRIQTTNSFAAVDATIQAPTGGMTAITVTASNVLQYTLYLNGNLVAPLQSYTIVTNGVSSPVYPGPAVTTTMYANLDGGGNITGWTTTNPFPNVLHKTPSIEGPIGHAYTSSFIVVYGSDPADLTEANNFCSLWNSHMEASISPRADSTITSADTAANNLILFGTTNSNTVLSQIQPYLPIQVDSAGVTIGTKRYAGTNYGAYYVYPNPQSPSKYVVINHKIIPGSQVKDMEALPWYWPDFVIFDTNKAAGACIQASLNYLPSTFVEAGYFDGYWNLPPGYVVADYSLSTSPASQTVTAGGGTSYTVSVTPSSGFTGTVSFSASGLPAGATSNFSPAAVTTSGSTTMTITTDASATPAGSYPLTITGTSGALSHSSSVTLVVNPVPTPPAAPTNLVAAAGDSTVSLNWQGSAGAASYNVLRSVTQGSGYQSVAAGLTATTYSDTGLTNGATYYYVVQAVNTAGTSGNSNEANATPHPLAPAAPVLLAPTAGNITVSLSWQPSTGATSYSVFRSTTSGSNCAQVGTPVTTTSFNDSGLTNGTKYYYVVQANNSNGHSPNSNEVSATPQPPAPAAPTGLSASVSSGTATLTWTASTGATSYNLLRSTTSNAEVLVRSGVTGTTYNDTGLTNGLTYYYKVQAVNGGGASANSSEVAVKLAVPTTPANLTAVTGVSSGQVKLTWTDASNNEAAFYVYRSTSSGGTYTNVATIASSTTNGTGSAITYTDSDLRSGRRYYYRVYAHNSFGNSGYVSGNGFAR